MEKKDKCAVCGLEFKVVTESESPPGSKDQPNPGKNIRVDALCPYCESPNEISWPLGMTFVVRPAK